MITIKPVRPGEVYLLQDQRPTPGSTGKHNYIIASNNTDNADYVLCFGITSCKNGVFEDVIPITSSNKYTAYINTRRIYLFSIADICNNGTYHGCVDNDASVLITKLMAIKTGYENTDKESILKRLNVVKVINGVVENKNGKEAIKTNDDKDEKDVKTVEEPKPEPKPQRRRQMRIKSLNTNDLIIISFLMEKKKGGMETLVDMYGLKKETIMSKKKGVKIELEERVNSFTKNALTYKLKPEFWALTDLYLFDKKYKSEYTQLCNDLGITQPQALCIYNNIYKYIEAKAKL